MRFFVYFIIGCGLSIFGYAGARWYDEGEFIALIFAAAVVNAILYKLDKIYKALKDKDKDKTDLS